MFTIQNFVHLVYLASSDETLPDSLLPTFQVGNQPAEGTCVWVRIRCDSKLMSIVLYCVSDLFGILRTLSHDVSFDVLQVAERLTVLPRIQHIFGEHPDWRRPNFRSGKLESLNARTYKADMSCRDVDFTAAWTSGMFY